VQTRAIDRSVAQPGATRDVFLDAIRAIAIARVVLWHATGAALVTYVVAAVPALVFVTGSLTTQSLDRRPWRAVVADRYRRLLIPYWAYAVVALAAMAVAAVVVGGASTELPWWALFTWLVPVVDPVGSQWQDGWLTSPLWFIRLMVWLIALSPLIVRCTRRLPAVFLLAMAAFTFATDLAARGDVDGVSERVLWYGGDIAMFAGFFALGVLHRDGRLAAPARTWGAVALIAACATAAWVLTQPVPDGVANDSHPAHALVGLTWLAIALASRPWVEAAAVSRNVAPIVHAVTRRSLSIYLWHSVAIVASYRLVDWGVDGIAGVSRVVVVLACTIVVTTGIVQLVGWLEDRAAQRAIASVRVAPRTVAPVALASGLLATALVVPSADAGLSLPEAPSAQPLAPMWEPAAPAPPAAAPPDAGSGPLDERVAEVAQRYAETTGTGLAVSVSTPSAEATWSTGGYGDGSPLGPDDPVPIQSVSKIVTAALVWEQIDAGTMIMDAPMPAPDRFPEIGDFTVRQALEHRSGVAEWRDTIPQPVAADADIDDALQAALDAPESFAAGTRQNYSSTNYLMLTASLEAVTGRSYAQLVDGLGVRLDLSTIAIRDDQEGRIAAGSGGLEASPNDLARIGDALFREGTLASPEQLDSAVAAIDPATTLGPGINGFCPCVEQPDGSRTFFGVGYSSSAARLTYVPDRDVIVVVQLDGTRSFEEIGDELTVLTNELVAATG
jgi:CubicO group peptidase (beta-lactamase class C family)/peptidoglycan/LPS O-acetylase OafA/YrhL